jgi:hypothetical protein
LSVYAAAKPEAPAAPTTAKQDVKMRVSWTMPDSNGLAVTQYEIQVEKSDGTFVTTTECNGADSTIVS